MVLGEGWGSYERGTPVRCWDYLGLRVSSLEIQGANTNERRMHKNKYACHLFRVWGLRFRVQGSGIGLKGLGADVSDVVAFGD